MFQTKFKVSAFKLTAIVTCLCLQLYSQNNTCVTFIEKSNTIYSSNPDSSFLYSQLALNCALESKDSLVEAQAYSHFGRYLLLKSNLHDAETNLNKALILFKPLNNKEGIAYVYKLKAIVQDRIKNNKAVIEFAEKAVALYEQTDSNGGLFS